MIRMLLNIILSPILSSLLDPFVKASEKKRREREAIERARHADRPWKLQADAYDERMRKRAAQDAPKAHKGPVKQAASAQAHQNVKSAVMTPDEFLQKFGITCFYHFTDTRNLPSIKMRGGLLPWAQVREDVLAPGGNDWSHDADVIKGQDNYVHLCFLPEHPMEFKARRDGRILESRFLRIDPSVIHSPGVLFCSDVANKSGVEMLGFTEAVKQMDFEIIAQAHKQWLDPQLFDRKRRACKYELLVPGQVPLSLIAGI